MSDMRHHATTWCKRGYYPLPIPYREKGPKLEHWQNLRVTAEDVPGYFNGQPANIGVLLGEPYGNCDIDLDCEQALTTWPHFAPETALIFGRKSRPRSHWFYRIDPPCHSVRYSDPVDRATLLEFRCLKTDGSVGLQTMVPPSVHPEGERIEFFEDGEPANVDAEELGRAARRAAAVALLARHWPGARSGRHDAFLALAGALAYARWDLAEANHLVCGLYQTLWPGNADLPSAVREVESTFQRHDDGHEITALPHLMKLISPVVVKSIAKWLALRYEPERKEKQVFAVRVLPPVWRMEGGEMEWIIEGLLAAGSVTLLSGDSGIGKSTLALQLAGSVACGNPFLERSVKQRPVLYIDRENPLFVVKERLHRLHIPETRDLMIWGLWNDPQPEGPDAESVVKFCLEEKPLVIFDALIAFHEGDEQSAQDTRKHMAKYRRLAATGTAVIVLHNTGKSETSKEYRGSSDIKAALDMGYLLETVGDATPGKGLANLRLVPFKTRVEPIDPIHIGYVDGRFEEAKEDRRPSESELFERGLRLHPGLSGRELIQILKGEVPKHRVPTLLLEGIQNSRIEVIPGGRGSGQRYRLRVQPELENL
jgi:hypothetical protein